MESLDPSSAQHSCIPHPGTRPGMVATLAMVALLLAACGAGGRQAATTPTSSAAPTASPTPPDVVSAFVGKLSNGLTADATLTGTIEVGQVNGTLAGTYVFGTNGDFSYQITTTIGGSQQVSRGVRVASTRYSRDGDGPWLTTAPSASASGEPGPADLFSHLAMLQDAGVVTHGGDRVHLLRAPGGLTVPPAALGLTDPSLVDPHATVDFYAQDDGTPAGMTVTATWSQGAAGATLAGKAVMDLTFSSVGYPITVTAPDDVWTQFESVPQHFTVDHPGAWGYKADAVSASFAAPDDSAGVWIGLGAEAKGLDQQTWNRAVLAGATKEFGRSDGSLTVTVAGIATTAYEFHGTSNGQAVFFMDVPVVRSGKGYEIQWYSLPGYEQDDIATFKTVLATFAFTK